MRLSAETTDDVSPFTSFSQCIMVLLFQRQRKEMAATSLNERTNY
jgi:hypothetical protein